MSPDADASQHPGGRWAAFRRAHLFDYNVAATRYWLLLCSAGACALGYALWRLQALPAAELWQVAGWLAVVGIAAAFPIQIPRTKHTIVGGDTVIFLLLALHGPAAAVAAAALEGLVGAIRSTPRLTSRFATTAAASLAMTGGGAAFVFAQPLADVSGLPPAAAHLAALAAAAVLYSIISTFSLMQVVCLKRGVSLGLGEWFAGASWIGALYLFSAAVAGMLSLHALQFGRSAVAVGVLIIGLALALLRSHFRTQIAAHEMQEARVAAAQRDAQQNERRFHSAFSRASIGMAIVAPAGRILQANEALHTLLGAETGALAGRNIRALLHAGDAPLLDRHVDAVLARQADRFSIELRCIADAGREIWVLLHCALFGEGSAAGDGTDAGLIFQLHDITSRRRAEGELRHIAFHDPLTDLANRNCFQARLSVAVETSRTDRRHRFAVMMLDLDRFKIVNDSLGHPAGDELLKEVGRRLAACVRPKDLVARIGGDEFAILLEDAHRPADAVNLGERLLQALALPLQINGTEVRPQASIGLTFSDLGYREPDEVLRDADLAMYQAKAGGKNRLELFDAGLHEQLGHKLQLEADLRRAIGDGQLSLVFQPLFELGAHRLTGFEALARWTHPLRGAVSPGVFIALAEETGCIAALTAWAIDQAVRQLADWRRSERTSAGLVMHVNVSGRDLSIPGFAGRVREILERHALPAALLVLEITESTLMEHRELALEALVELGELGVKVGIDDFGTGYSSLAYLSTLPFDCLKIDRSFVIGMEHGRQNLEIVRAVISLAHSLNKQVVAEGIETHEQLQQLRALGATYGQGYLLSRPLQPQQALNLLRDPHIAAV